MTRRDSLGRAIMPRFADALASWTRHDSGPRAWMLRAACRGSNLELWFPPETRRGRWVRQQKAGTVAAKLICRECPVIGDCLAHALNANEAAGIWGGHTTEERRELLRRKRIT